MTARPPEPVELNGERTRHPVAPALAVRPVARGPHGPAPQSPVVEFLRVLRRGWLVLTACAVVGGTAGYVAAAAQESEYQATSVLLFGDPSNDFGQQLFGAALARNRVDPQTEAATRVRLVSLKTISRLVSRQLNGALPPDRLQRMVSVEQAGGSDLVAITATHTDPALAARVVNAFARQYVAYRRRSDQSKLLQASSLINRRLEASNAKSTSDEIARLRSLKDRLSVLSTLQTGNAEVVQTATPPTSPSAPRPKLSAALGMLLGLVVGLPFLFARSQLDRRVRDPEEVEAITGWPVLAAVPQDRALQRTTSATRQTEAAPEVHEACRLLRARLRYFSVDRPLRRLLITSSISGEGKTTIVRQLAVAYAEAGERVLVIEADLRRPTLGSRIVAEHLSGLTELLTNQLDQAKAIQTATLGPRKVKVDLLLAGAAPPNPAQLLESARMSELLSAVGESYDIVLVDTPPATVVSDAIPLTQLVDGVIVVSRVGLTDRVQVARLARELQRLDAPTLGVVLNAVPGGAEGYGYGYYAAEDRPPGRDAKG